MGLSSIEVKKANKNSVLRYILTTEQFSKNSVAQALDLSVPTVTQALRELQQIGFVKEAGMLESIGGRKAMGFRCVKDFRVAVGVDITRNHVNVVIVNLALETLYYRRVNVCIKDEATYGDLKKVIENAISESGVDREKILGLGISIPAIPDGEGRRITHIHEQMLGCKNLDQVVGTWFPYPVIFGNDADNAGRAELHCQKVEKDAVFFFVSPSVGGALIHDGEIRRGRQYRAGEFGHMILYPKGKPCYCGRIGCVDPYCNTNVLSDHTDGSLDVFFRELKEGNEKFRKIWEEYLDYIALAIHNLLAAFDSNIIIGGYLGQHIGPYMGELKARIKRMDPYLEDDAFVRPASLKYEASAIGIASVFVEDFLNQI